MDSGFDSLDKPLLGSIGDGGGSIPEIGTVPGDNEGPVGFETCVYDNDGDQAYASLGDSVTLLSLQPESLCDQPLSLDFQNTSDGRSHFQDESNNTSAGGESPDSIVTALEPSLSTTSSTSTTLQSNEDNATAQLHPPSSDTESDSGPSSPGLDTEVNNSLEGTAPVSGTHEARDINVNRAHDTNPDALPSATLSNVRAQTVRYREIIIRGPVMEDRTEVINERVLVELSSSPK